MSDPEAPASSGGTRRLRNPAIIAAVIGLLGGAGFGMLKYTHDVAYNQGVLNERTTRIEAKNDHAIAEVVVTAAKVEKDLSDRAHRVRDDFDAYKELTSNDLVTIKTGVAKIEQLLVDRLPVSSGKQASFSEPGCAALHASVPGILP